MQLISRVILYLLALHCSTASATNLLVERLTWAGVRMEMGSTTVFIDAVGRDIWNGAIPDRLAPVAADTPRRYALLTHLHNDHFDATTLRRVLGEHGYVICHRSEAAHVASRGFRVITADDYVPIERGGFTFTAVPAEDGFGDLQVSWIIRAGETQFLHAGDTLWHGLWARLGRQYGPFDTVFLPVNAARLGGGIEIKTPAVMDPRQALDAATLLRARRMVPIHYGFSDPPGYVEVPTPIATLRKLAPPTGVIVEALRPGELLAPFLER